MGLVSGSNKRRCPRLCPGIENGVFTLAVEGNFSILVLYFGCLLCKHWIVLDYG